MSQLPFELLLALRYLRPKRTVFSFITLISVLGVTLGVAVLIIVISVMTGFDHDLREKILGFNTHLKVMLVGEEPMTNWKEVARIVESNRNVKATAPFVVGPLLILSEPPEGHHPQVGTPYVRGLIPQLETNISVLPYSIVQGKFDFADRGIVIGSSFADRMGLQVGDRVEIGSPSMLIKWRENSQNKDAKAPVLPEYEVRGIFSLGYYEYDLSMVLTSLEDAQDLYDLGNGVHGVLVMLQNPYRAQEVARELQRALGPRYGTRTWMDENSNLLDAVLVEKNVMYYILFFIMIVAALCILSALITFVVQKTREIGMLKALGATNVQVGLIFLSQGAMVGALGDLTGFGLGMLALAYRNEFLDFLRRMTGFELFPPSVYGFSQLPALIGAQDIVVICGVAWLLCTLGGLIPAWRAARLRPVEALRYE